MSRLTADVQGSTNIRAEHHNLARREAEASSYLLAYGDTNTAKIFVSPGVAYFGSDMVEFAGGSSALITDPTASDRIDMHYLDSAGALQVMEGTEDDSPTAPALPVNVVPIAQVYNRPGQTIIDDSDQGGGDGYIDKDTRPFLHEPYIPKVVASTATESAAPAQSTTEDVVEVTIPAGTIGVSNIVEFWIPVISLSASNGEIVLKIKLGSTQLTILTKTTDVGAAGIIHGFIMGDASASAQRVIVNTQIGGADTGDGSGLDHQQTNTAAMTEDSATDLTLTLQITRAGGNAISIETRGIIVTKIR